MKDFNNHFEESNTAGTLSECFIEELTDEIKVISYLIQCVGDSVGTTGVPADPQVLNQALAQLCFKLDNVAEVLETVQEDIEGTESAADLTPLVLKVPGSDPVRIMAEDNLKTYQSLVGGYIERLPVTEEIEALCNENGLLQNLPKNCTINGQTIYGNIVFNTSDIDQISQLIQS